MANEPRAIKIRDALLVALDAINSNADPATYWTTPYVARGPMASDVALPRVPAILLHLGTLTVQPVSDHLYDATLEIVVTLVVSRGADAERELWRLWHDAEEAIIADPQIIELAPDGLLTLNTLDCITELEGAGDYAIGNASYSTHYHYVPGTV